MELNARKKQILKSVVDLYISTGEPVGSKSLAGALRLSSATIRNEMNELESMGFLKQPHTSAGRIPSNEGYREYVASLMRRYDLTIEEIALIDSLLEDKLTEFQELLEIGTRLLSHMTQYAAVSLSAKEQTGSLHKLECIYVNEHSFLLAAIFSDNTTRTRQVHTAELSFDEATLSAACAALNRRFAKRPIREVMAMLAAPKTEDVPPLSMLLCHALYQVLEEQKRYRVDVEGLSNLLQYPEFSNLARTREILGLLEEKERLIKHLTEVHRGEISISIGSDDAPELDATSMIVRTFQIGGDMVGALGIIGPKRMEYSGTVARLEYLAKHILPANPEEYTEEKE